MTKDRDEVEAALRGGIHDAYRLGIGYAISTIEEFRGTSADPASFDTLLAHLRDYSAKLWTAEP